MKNTYIKSPLNYTGGKYKLLPQIIPMLPSNINTFVDLFGGGFNVGINIKANKIIYNDTISELVILLKNLYNINLAKIFIICIWSFFSISLSILLIFLKYFSNGSEYLIS